MSRPTYAFLMMMFGSAAVFLQGCGGVKTNGVCKSANKPTDTQKKCRSADEKCVDKTTKGVCTQEKECTCQKGVESNGVCKTGKDKVSTKKECQKAHESCIDKDGKEPCTNENECRCHAVVPDGEVCKTANSTNIQLCEDQRKAGCRVKATNGKCEIYSRECHCLKLTCQQFNACGDKMIKDPSKNNHVCADVNCTKEQCCMAANTTTTTTSTTTTEKTVFRAVQE